MILKLSIAAILATCAVSAFSNGNPSSSLIHAHCPSSEVQKGPPLMLGGHNKGGVIGDTTDFLNTLKNVSNHSVNSGELMNLSLTRIVFKYPVKFRWKPVWTNAEVYDRINGIYINKRKSPISIYIDIFGSEIIEFKTDEVEDVDKVIKAWGCVD